MLTPMRALTLTVTPEVGPLWLRRDIEVTGAVPGSLVTLSAETDRNGHVWAAQATFLADADGAVNLVTEAPVSGDYRVADPMGLFWAQHREEESGFTPAEPADPRPPILTRITAHSVPGTGFLVGEHTPAPKKPAEIVVEQWLVGPDVSRREIREHGLVGTLFTPEGTGPHPTVIVLNGSGGGINEARAALYASRGIQALALGYFRAPGLSQYISNTPLEYFKTALDFVTRELSPLGGAPVVSGQSRGGELSLLLASWFPDLIAGIAPFVPWHTRCGAQGAADPESGWSGPTWTWQGKPLEHLWNDNSHIDWQPWSGGASANRHDDVYIMGMQDYELAQASRIEIERFAGPIACVSALDDRAWPSSWASRVVMRTLEQSGHQAERLHLDYAEAGHAITIPYMPATEISRTHPVSGVPYSNGGTPLGNAKASMDSFEQMCEFIPRAANHQRKTQHVYP